MNQSQLHPNTQTLLSACERMNRNSSESKPTPQNDVHPDLLKALFVIEKTQDNLWVFRNAGQDVRERLGRDMTHYNFLEMWQGYDRIITRSIIHAVVENAAPAILQAHAMTSSGVKPKVEITLASLSRVNVRIRTYRLIGLYQPLDMSFSIDTHSAWQHRLDAVFLPQTKASLSHLRLVASNR